MADVAQAPAQLDNAAQAVSSGAAPRMAAIGAEPDSAWRCNSTMGQHWSISLNCFEKIDGATFTMGAQSTDPAAPSYDALAQPDELPVRQVTVAPFWIQHSETNAALYKQCITAGVCSKDDVISEGGFSTLADPERQKHPVTGVTWQGATKLCGWLGGRLPTEAEWELAARGTEGRLYPWGNKPACGYAVDRTGRTDESGKQSCAATGPREGWDQPMAGLRGIQQLSGNVWEWALDWYGPYDAAATTDPRGPATGTRRVQRGGGWRSESSADFRGAGRASAPPDQKLPDMGFRCVWTGRPE